MEFLEGFKSQLLNIDADGFDELALELFRYQVAYNPIYRNYIYYLRKDPNSVKKIEDIPFLPIGLFKSHQVKTGDWQSVQVFESSGTTGAVTSKHHLPEPDFYLKHSQAIFEKMYGPLNQYHILALLPSYRERGHSSLVYMVDYFIKESYSRYSGFYLNDVSSLQQALERAYMDTSRKTLLFGVSYALLDMVERKKWDMPHLTVMETGGMKGRRKEMVREELHALLTKGFGVDGIHSEYGMTELLSQAYAPKNGLFELPATMRILLRDLNDPLSSNKYRKRGGMNIIDLANFHSCAFLETQDIGYRDSEGKISVLGRFDNSDIRGCSLLIS